MSVYSCLFEPTDDPKVFRCACGAKASSAAAVAYPCRLKRGCKVEPQLPSLRRRAHNFGGAMVNWATNGFHTSGEALKLARLAVCHTCDLCVGGKCLHQSCGCPVERKAAVKSEGCPLGKWATCRVTSQVTFGITAFERPEHLDRLVLSILEFYPGAQIIVADNGTRKATLPASVKLLDVPYDCGLSAARNAVIDALETPYYLVLEEDFRFTAETKIEKLLDVLEYHPEVGFVGAALRHNNVEGSPGVRHDYAIDFHTRKGVLYGAASGGFVLVTDSGTPYRLCHKVYNFGLGRKAFFSDHRWDDDLKLAEHTGFFLEAYRRGKWQIAQCPAVCAEHDRWGRDEVYNDGRNRFRPYMSQWCDKAGIESYAQQASVDNCHEFPLQPNILVMGIGHSRTTILAQMLMAAGWTCPMQDARFAECLYVRDLNDALLIKKKPIPRMAAAERLDAFPQPWVVKDPRFVLTLDRWLPALSEQDRPPLLVWIKRDRSELERSYARRAERFPDGTLRLQYAKGWTLEAIEQEAQRQFDLYPYVKIEIDSEDLAQAVALFKSTEELQARAADSRPSSMQIIPRVFHRVWLGGKSLPSEFVEFGRTWLRHNPDWQLREWREHDIEQIADAKPLVTGDLWKRAKNFAQASDVLRYELLYRFGGVYLDTDFEALKPLGSLLDGASFVGAGENPGRMVSAGFIAAIPGHSIVAKALEMLPGRMAGDLPQATASGPGMLTEAWLPHADEPGIVRYGPELFYPYGFKEKHRRHEVFPDAVAAHHWHASWLPGH